MPPSPADPPDDPLSARCAFSDLALAVFRLNGSLIEAGDALVHDLGLTSARWQVLGAIALAPAPLPVAHIARNMGLARQSVQRVVDDMQAEELVRLEPNPHHRRAALVAMTPRGEAAYAQAIARKDLWADALTAGLPPATVAAAAVLLRTIQDRIDASRARIAAIANATRREIEE